MNKKENGLPRAIKALAMTNKGMFSYPTKNREERKKRFITDFCGMVRRKLRRCHREERSDAAIRSLGRTQKEQQKTRIAAHHKGARNDRPGYVFLSIKIREERKKGSSRKSVQKKDRLLNLKAFPGGSCHASA